MADSALVHNLQTLTDLRDALGRFAHDAQESLRAAEADVSRAQQWIQQRVWHWQRQVQQAQQGVRRAQAALNRCQSQVHVGRDGRRRVPDCRSEERAVATAERRLRETEAQLRKAQQWKTRLESAAGEYRRHAGRLQRLASTHTPRSRAFLERLATELERYLAVTPATGVPSGEAPLLSPLAQSFVGFIPGSDSSGQSQRSHGYAFEKAKQEMLRRALDNPKVSSAIRGWIKQEVNRMERARQARVGGYQPPGGNPRRMRIPPGVDAGHRIPGLDKPENLRFELASMNRARWHLAKRLGVEHKYR